MIVYEPFTFVAFVGYDGYLATETFVENCSCWIVDSVASGTVDVRRASPLEETTDE